MSVFYSDMDHFIDNLGHTFWRLSSSNESSDHFVPWLQWGLILLLIDYHGHSNQGSPSSRDIARHFGRYWWNYALLFVRILWLPGAHIVQTASSTHSTIRATANKALAGLSLIKHLPHGGAYQQSTLPRNVRNAREKHTMIHNGNSMPQALLFKNQPFMPGPTTPAYFSKRSLIHGTRAQMIIIDIYWC